MLTQSLHLASVDMSADLKTGLGFGNEDLSARDEHRLKEFINLKLAARGAPIWGRPEDYPYLQLGESLLANFREKSRILRNYLCPADQRIQDFLTAYLGDLPDEDEILVPTETMVLERHGLSKMLSLPADSDVFRSPIVESYRVEQGVLHNPAHDRRTTKGVFHVTEGGFPIPADKKAVPRDVFINLLRHALRPPEDLLNLPFTSTQEEQAKLFLSLLLRPTVCPKVEGFTEEKTMEIRFFAPGNLVSNLDFVESIFGNAGDPFLPDNDAGLDLEHWSGQTGCIILAPQLVNVTKKELGLPHLDEASERQIRDGMCWQDPEERYNDGNAFKVACRDHRGVMVTLIADNYFGYCKKEVKTQISFAANLYGVCEEEHAGGALAFPSYDLGEDFSLSSYSSIVDHTFEEAVRRCGDLMEVHPEGYGTDLNYPDIVYLPENVTINLQTQQIKWSCQEREQSLKLLPARTYVLPSGYKVEMRKPARGRRWRLIGTTAEGTFCHKPCTVSGGGKSEISKSIADAMITGPVIIYDIKKDFDQVEAIIRRDFSDRFADPTLNRPDGRPILSTDRSLGSVVKLLTPGPEYTDATNDWLRSIPDTIRDLVLLVKRLYKPDWEDDWRHRFTVDSINEMPGHELKYRNQKMVTQYLRVGFHTDGSWRTFRLRKDFYPAFKIQMEDDISASVVVPARLIRGLRPDLDRDAWKFVANCEFRLFQRPDEAVNRGYDQQTEKDFSIHGNFFSNYQPLDRREAIDLVEDAIRFDQFTEPMQRVITDFSKADHPDYIASTAHPRIVDGKPSQNPRYLQTRPDLLDPRGTYLSSVGMRLYRRLTPEDAIATPVNAVLPGRRNNPPDRKAGIKALAVYNPIHYQELPELFMDFIASLTGKSPSTTGAGSEGALTKGPFNALPAIIDLNNALVSYLVTGYEGFTTAAGHIGPDYQVDHDISLLVPEVASRMSSEERSSAYLIEQGYLEACRDFEYEGKPVLASRLGYRITEHFARTFFGRIFSNPAVVLPEAMLKPETQDLEVFVEGIENIVTAHRNVARLYFDDATVELACPPLKALLHIMAHGDFEGKDVHDPSIRALFTREALYNSDWYQQRLAAKQGFDVAQANRFLERLQAFRQDPLYTEACGRMGIDDLLNRARDRAEKRQTKDYAGRLVGTIGLDPATLPPETKA